MSRATILGVVGVVALPLLLVCAVAGLALLPALAAGGSACVPAGGVPGYSADQVSNAATIVAVGQRLQVPRRGWVVAVATAMQESNLHNLGDLGERNDHDSLGLFQQRPSMGWGTPAQVMDPTYAATQFYQHLLRVPDWQRLPLTVAAQDVQRSAYPDAYAKWETAAAALVSAVTTDCATASASGASAQVGASWS